jgi:dihydrofolate reductase
VGDAVLPTPLAPPDFACVVAADQNRGIGRDNRLPWPRLRADLAHLKQVTSTTRAPGARNAVIMGRRTWESVPPRFRPLPDRLNLVVSRGDLALPANALPARSLDQALQRATEAGVELVFVLGGGQLFAEAIADPRCRLLYHTRINGVFLCDTFFPAFEDRFILAEALPPHHQAGVSYQIERWRGREGDERQGTTFC